jgi:hypothetical protein
MPDGNVPIAFSSVDQSLNEEDLEAGTSDPIELASNPIEDENIGLEGGLVHRFKDSALESLYRYDMLPKR